MKRKLSPWCKEVKKTLIDRDMSVTELCGEVALNAREEADADENTSYCRLAYRPV